MDWPELPVVIKHCGLWTNSLSACWDEKNWWVFPNLHYHEVPWTGTNAVHFWNAYFL